MVSITTYKKLALSLPGSGEFSHFEKLSYKVKGKIFTTLDETNHTACVKLSPVDQSSFCIFDRTAFYPVNNKWGKAGWTNIDLKKVKKEMLVEALNTAYSLVAPKKSSTGRPGPTGQLEK